MVFEWFFGFARKLLGPQKSHFPPTLSKIKIKNTTWTFNRYTLAATLTLGCQMDPSNANTVVVEDNLLCFFDHVLKEIASLKATLEAKENKREN